MALAWSLKAFYQLKAIYMSCLGYALIAKILKEVTKHTDKYIKCRKFR